MDVYHPFISKAFLRSVLDHEYQAFRAGTDETELLDRLTRWAARPDLGERSAEAALIEEFFRQTWGYVQAGQPGAEQHFSLFPQFPVPGGARRGGQGTADAALGYFPRDRKIHTPQVLCEFKDIRNRGLDAPQGRKDDNRSPVQQGLGYLAAARRGIFGNEPIIPMYAIITDMNEFRLYWADRGERQSLRFVISPRDLFQGEGLLANTEEAKFDRFLFMKIFHRDMLTAQSESGRPRLHSLVAQQRFQQRDLENTYYTEYRAFREHLYDVLLECNPPGSERFPGTRGRLLRLGQKILDRCIFIFFCEDMGGVLNFPPQLLRDFLTSRSTDTFFDRNGSEVWSQLRRLFSAMNEGTVFGGRPINRFNGGLFAEDAALDRLKIPNFIFCELGQGQSETSLDRHKKTLLYLCAAYNYAADLAGGLARAPGGGRDERKLGLYTLGRIFEQSITELEILEAEADDRPSVNKVSKRKRDGVYYTPEWVVERIVSEALGERLADLKRACGWPDAGTTRVPSEAEIRTYERALREVRVVDPACGSGAFLITVLRYLLDEWRALRDLRRVVAGDVARSDEDVAIAEILSANIYGVDINPASVEIAKLALWLHTARGNRPLSSLDEHIVEGNSLIGLDFYNGLAPYTAEERERINAFDWHSTFPEVFAKQGFDVVVGNPPYVKFQNFRKVHADMANYLALPRAENGAYNSTQSGNFDLYLPFIEKGISLLNPDGRLGYICPSLWTIAEYGSALRDDISLSRSLYGWIDFGAFQVFEEATTYCALQFYSKRGNDTVKFAKSLDGYIPEEPWAVPGSALPYSRLGYADRWLLLAGAERDLIDRLSASCLPLSSLSLTRNIYQGLITSADQVFHLEKRGAGRYICSPKGSGAPPPFEVRIEDEIMKPLTSGVDTKRYVTPRAETYILFPYRLDAGGIQLISASEMERSFPLAWAYLRRWESELRAREKQAFDDNHWWRFGRTQNLDKQEVPKLLVPRLVSTLSCAVDEAGTFYLDNVDVGGITPARGISLWFLAGVLNGKVADFVFRRISKPFRGEYRSANRQYLEPLPIPIANKDQQEDIATEARSLQSLTSSRRDTISDIARRFATINPRPQPEEWLFPDLPTLDEIEQEAPAVLQGADRWKWAKTERARRYSARSERLGADLLPGVELDATFARGELRFFVDGVAVIEGIFLNDPEGEFALSQWKVLASTYSITDGTTGDRLAKVLRRVALTAPEPLRGQIIALSQTLRETEAAIVAAEEQMNRKLYVLYKLTPDEIALIETT